MTSVSAWQTLGPFFDRQLAPDEAADLTRIAPGAPRAAGDVIEIYGDVREEGGVSVAGALIEVWQADAAGRYAHPADRSDRPGDPHFRGFGRCLTGADGRYRFVTIRPGAVPAHGYQWQAPHILFSIFAAGLLRRLVTRMYFPEEPANQTDPVLATVDPAARPTLIATRERGAGETAVPPRYRFDLILRGKGETAFFVD